MILKSINIRDMKKSIQDCKQVLKEYFGYDDFRPLQEEIIQQILDAKDALVLMPTGGGKSLCFQIPALVMDGTCIVVSPLISLMKDQVGNLLQCGVSAAFIHSGLSYEEQENILQNIGDIKLLYMSPERFIQSDIQNIIYTEKINLLAIDEAHCISVWGHDFRPEYASLGQIKVQKPDLPVIALTATADQVTREDIVEKLHFRDKKAVFIASFDRPNIHFSVEPGLEKFRRIRAFIEERPETSGIIYCLSRKETERLANKLQTVGIDARAFHAGMSFDDKERIQDDFIQDNCRIICATIAFGMGIDKPNVRWVIHHNLPKNIENYFQEVGRGGRDGLDSEALLLYSYSDVLLWKKINEESSQKELLNSKLDRVFEYADASICRRRILLNYFNESSDKDCGNCDVCENPPQIFDGTTLIQKALSALKRAKESIGASLLVQVLRGSYNSEVMDRGLHEIPTFGLGKEYSFFELQHYLLQMIQLGLIEPKYKEHNYLKVCELGEEVLFKNRKVQLVKFEEKEAKAKAQKNKQKPVEKTLFDLLRAKRLELARKEAIPAYMIFGDATLKEMEQQMPVRMSEMESISGIGKLKLEKYAAAFLEVIQDHYKGLKGKGDSFKHSCLLYQDGKSVAEIARLRNVKEMTVVSHLAAGIQKGMPLDVDALISEAEKELIGKTYLELGKPKAMKPIFEHLDMKYSYTKIRLGLAFYS